MMITAKTFRKWRTSCDNRIQTVQSQWSLTLVSMVVCAILCPRSNLLADDKLGPPLAPFNSKTPHPVLPEWSPSNSASLEVSDMERGGCQPLCSGDDLGSLPSRFEETLREAQRQRARRMEDLHGQIDVVLGLIRSTTNKSPRVDSVPPPEPASDDSDESSESSVDTSSDAARPPVADRAAPGKVAIPPSDKAISTTDPAARISLADNLFGAGDIALALEIYQGLQTESLDASEMRWVNYQIASCQRRIGSVSSAEQNYREVANASDDDLASANARWWLDAIGRRKRLQSGLDGLNQAIRTMESEIREQSNE